MRNLGCIVGRTDLLLQIAENQKSNKFWTLIYVKSGVGMCLIGGQLTCLNEGDILFFPPGIACSFVSDDLGDEYNENIELDECYVVKLTNKVGETFAWIGDINFNPYNEV